MRRCIPIFVVIAGLLAPGVASATTETASAGGITATLSYRDGPGIRTKNERLTITQTGKPVYDERVPATGCIEVCSPLGPRRAVHVVDLYGDGEYAVVLDLFTGGASCCGLEQVYVPSASTGSWVLTERNFGEDGARMETLSGHVVFVSGDNAFACAFVSCAGSGMPLQIFDFTGDAFHNVTRRYPHQIARDAAFWWRTYKHNLSDGPGLIAPWAADEDNLGKAASVRRVLAAQVRDHHITAGFERQLQAFLKRHGYAG